MGGVRRQCKTLVTIVSVMVGCLLFLPASASAQSAIAGFVTDTTGALLPGVTVEAMSPALIEKIRVAVTDSQGRYTIVDLRPGIYTVTFKMPGFTTLVRADLELPSNFTAPVNAELSVGTIEETVTVSGQTPVVDVQSAQRTQVLARDVLDSIPSTRTTTWIGAIIPGVKMGRPNVGGIESADIGGMSVHGLASSNTTLMIDGMMINEINGPSIQNFPNDGMIQEMSYQTSAVSAETSAGGVRLNLIPKDGGNQFSGAVFMGGSDGDWQSENVTPELNARGLQTVSALKSIFNLNVSGGGPIVRNRLWFYTSGLRNVINDVVANSFFDDGTPAGQDQSISNVSLRLTAQLTPRNKFTAHYDRSFKFKGHDMFFRVPTQVAVGGVDPETAARRRDPVLYYMGQLKWTSTVSSRLLLEAGYSSNIESRTNYYQPDIRKDRGTPEWLRGAARVDLERGTMTTAATDESAEYPLGYQLLGAATYVTGSHAFKTGVQWRFGTYMNGRTANADLVQWYRGGVGESVDVYNTPVESRNRIDADMGIYVQDSWTIKRLTFNPGVRIEYFKGSLDAQSAGAGRFAPARYFEAVPNMPNWSDVAPRVSAVYNLFGDGRTALKASVNKYMLQQGGEFANRYNPMIFDTDRRDWRDSNGDDIAQESEIGASNNRNFGLRPSRNPAPNIQREYNIEYSLGVQHQVMPGASVNAVWYKRTFHNLPKADNLLVDVSDYASFERASPLDGELITMYNLNRAKQGLVDILDANSKSDQRIYNGFELSFTARLRGGGTAFGGWTPERTVSVTCDTDDPNLLRFCDQRELDVPFRHDAKLAASYPLWYGFQTSMSFQSYAGLPLGVNWIPAASVFPGGQRTSTVTVPLVAPGKQFLNRMNQLDFGVKRIFRTGRAEMQVQVDIFNALNSSVVLEEVQTLGAALGRPNRILQGRLPRIAMQMRF